MPIASDASIGPSRGSTIHQTEQLLRGARLRTLRRRCDAPSSAPIIQIASAALSTQLQRGCCLVAASLAHSLRPWRLQHVVAGQFDRPATDRDLRVGHSPANSNAASSSCIQAIAFACDCAARPLSSRHRLSGMGVTVSLHPRASAPARACRRAARP